MLIYSDETARFQTPSAATPRTATNAPQDKQRLAEGTFWLIGSVASAATALFGGQIFKDATQARVETSIAGLEKTQRDLTPACITALDDPATGALDRPERFAAILKGAACGTDRDRVGDIVDLDIAMKNYVQNERQADLAADITTAAMWTVSLGLFWKSASVTNTVLAESLRYREKTVRSPRSTMPVSPSMKPVVTEAGETTVSIAETDPSQQLPPRTIIDGGGVPSYLVEPGEPRRLL